MDYETILIQLGFTQSQANLYLALLKTGQADAKTLSTCSKVPTPVVYRTLHELQEMGLVEKVIATPYKFKAVPPSSGLSVLIRKRIKSYQELEEKAKELFQQSEYAKEVPSEKETQLTLVLGKERIINLYKSTHDNAQKNVDIISNWQRWLQILYYCLEHYKRALKRGVNYRVIVDQPENEAVFLGKVQELLASANFKLGLVQGCIKVNMAVFNGKAANFVLYPGKALSQSPVIFTNNPSIIALFKSHFGALWKSAKRFEGKAKGE